MIEIRERRAGDAAALESLLVGATRELRRVYRPRPVTDRPRAEAPAVLVAVEDGHVVGVAEYLIVADEMVVQGAPASPD